MLMHYPQYSARSMAGQRGYEAMACLRAWTVCKMSCSAVWAPKVKRSEDWASASVLPMAFRTWEGSSLEALQAEPAAHKIPAASNWKIRRSLSQPGNVTCTLLGKRTFREPLVTASKKFDSIS